MSTTDAGTTMRDVYCDDTIDVPECVLTAALETPGACVRAAVHLLVPSAGLKPHWHAYFVKACRTIGTDRAGTHMLLDVHKEPMTLVSISKAPPSKGGNVLVATLELPRTCLLAAARARTQPKLACTGVQCTVASASALFIDAAAALGDAKTKPLASIAWSCAMP